MIEIEYAIARLVKFQLGTRLQISLAFPVEWSACRFLLVARLTPSIGRLENYLGEKKRPANAENHQNSVETSP